MQKGRSPGTGIGHPLQAHSGDPPTLHIFHVSLTKHKLINVISSLVKTQRPDMCVPDKEDRQNVQCWGPQDCGWEPLLYAPFRVDKLTVFAR